MFYPETLWSIESRRENKKISSHYCSSSFYSCVKFVNHALTLYNADEVVLDSIWTAYVLECKCAIPECECIVVKLIGTLYGNA